MPRIGRDSSTGRFTVRSEPESETVVIRNNRTGKILALKGYGALKGEYVVRKGINLSKPIAAQATAKKKSRARIAKTSSRAKRRKS
jgi:hypothetical protein